MKNTDIHLTLTEEESNVLAHAVRFCAVVFKTDWEEYADELFSILRKNESAQLEPKIRELNRKAGLDIDTWLGPTDIEL